MKRRDRRVASNSAGREIRVVPVLVFPRLSSCSVVHDAPYGVPGTRPNPGGSDARCDAVAEVCGLTAREREVLGYLSRGRNAQFLQKRLGISSGTAKAHITHVYRKTGVRGLQELLDLIYEQPAEQVLPDPYPCV